MPLFREVTGVGFSLFVVMQNLTIHNQSKHVVKTNLLTHGWKGWALWKYL